MTKEKNLRALGINVRAAMTEYSCSIEFGFGVKARNREAHIWLWLGRYKIDLGATAHEFDDIPF